MIVRNGPKRPRYPLALIHPLGPLFRFLPLSLRRHLLYLRALGKWGNFRTPRLAGEKAQWRIINDRRPLLAFVEDKLASKEYVKRALAKAGLLGQIRFPKTYWVGTDLRELQSLADQLPARWVLKPNHSCGRLMSIDSNAEPLNWEAMSAISSRWLERDEEELVMGHWAYSQARHLLIAEERVGSPGIGPIELKVLSLSGEAQYFFHEDRFNYNGCMTATTPTAPASSGVRGMIPRSTTLMCLTTCAYSCSRLHALSAPPLTKFARIFSSGTENSGAVNLPPTQPLGFLVLLGALMSG